MSIRPFPKSPMALITIVLFAALHTTSAAQNFPSRCPALKWDYAPPGDTLLATSTLGPITDTDLFTFLTIMGDEDPNLYSRYLRAKSPQEKKQIVKKIKEAIESYVLMRTLAKKAPPISGQDEVESLRLRLKSYPAYELVWVDEALRPRVRVQDADIVAYYSRHSERYTRPASVNLRLMYLPAPELLPELERQKVREKIEALHKRATSGEDFANLVKKYSAHLSGVSDDDVMLIQKTKEYNRIYEEARAIKVGTISPVFQREEGFFFLKCLEKKDPESVPIADVRQEITKILEARSLQFLYTMELKKLKKRYHPEFKWGSWEEMPDSHVLVKVGKLKITRKRIWRLFPDIIGANFTLDESLVRKKVRYIHQYECIRLDVEKRGLSDDVRISRGSKVAAEQVRAQRFLDDFLAPLKRVSEKELKSFYDHNPQLSTKKAWRQVKHIVGEVINPRQYTPDEYKAVHRKMEDAFESLKGEAKKVVAAQNVNIGDIWTTESAVLPITLFDNLLEKYSCASYKFEVRDMGRIHPGDRAGVWHVIYGLAPGEFSRTETALQFTHCYYVEQAFNGKRLPFKDLKGELMEHLIRSRFETATNALKETILQNAQLTYTALRQ